MSGSRCSDRTRSCPLDRFHQVFSTDDVRTGGLGFISLGATGEHGDADRLARAVRQGHDATDHLVGVTRVNAEVHRDFKRFVELGRRAA
jgi:hypothetical protein